MKGNWENEKAKLRIDPSFSSETFFLWSTILLLHFFFLLSFLSVTSYRLQLRFQTRVIDWFSRFTSACHVRPFSLRRRCPPFQSSHRCTHKETRLCILSCVISFWSKRNYPANIYYLRIIFGYTGKRTVKIIFQIVQKNVWNYRRILLN